MKKVIIGGVGILFLVTTFLSIKFYSEESQNEFKRLLLGTYGFKHGRVDVLAGQQKPVMTWLGVEKLTSASASQGSGTRNYRYGFGYYDANLNNQIDSDERALGTKYFELGPYTMYVYRDAGSDGK